MMYLSEALKMAMKSKDATIGRALRAAREARKRIRPDLAKALGCSYQQIGKYEAGDTRIPASNLFLLATALDVNVDLFFTGLQDCRDRIEEKQHPQDLAEFKRLVRGMSRENCAILLKLSRRLHERPQTSLIED